MDEGRLPTSLYVDAVLKQCEIDFIPYYVLQKGEHASGVILAKLNALDGTAALRMQQRDFMTGQLGWTDALSEDKVEEAKADEYIARSKQRDPDLWVIEFESRDLINPFEKAG
tara:strand:+ start:1457 stop:1795 length:339 start_codon:yes stop_codon:yes gene_type:complete